MDSTQQRFSTWPGEGLQDMQALLQVLFVIAGAKASHGGAVTIISNWLAWYGAATSHHQQQHHHRCHSATEKGPPWRNP